MAGSLSPTGGDLAKWVRWVCVLSRVPASPSTGKSINILLNNCYVLGTVPGAGGYHGAQEKAGPCSQSLAGRHVSTIIIGDLIEYLLSSRPCSKCFYQSGVDRHAAETSSPQILVV